MKDKKLFEYRKKCYRMRKNAILIQKSSLQSFFIKESLKNFWFSGLPTYLLKYKKFCRGFCFPKYKNGFLLRRYKKFFQGYHFLKYKKFSCCWLNSSISWNMRSFFKLSVSWSLRNFFRSFRFLKIRDFFEKIYIKR